MTDDSLNSHIENLKAQHQALKKTIAARESDEIYNDQDMQALKRKKLLLKDEIARSETILQANAAEKA